MLGHRRVLALGGEWEVWSALRRPFRDFERYGIFDRATTIDGIDVTNVPRVFAGDCDQSVVDMLGMVPSLDMTRRT